MDKADIPFLSAAELSGLLQRREVSPVEATEAYLARIDDLDSRINSYITVCPDEAHRSAREAERSILRGNYLGPMHGIPVAVKDQFWTKGIRTTGGSRILGDFIPDEDATVVANLERAGAIILGKANLTEFAMTAYTHCYGVPHNPWNLEMDTGASSSGSAAATAAFFCATSLGEDTGGSIRMPASWCGLVGLRPSWGRVSRYGVMRGVWSMDTVGPMSRTVEDASITLGAIAGHDPKDPYSWNSPVPDYRSVLNGDIKGLRVGMIMEPITSGLVEQEVEDAFVKATSVLGEAGASLDEVTFPVTVPQAFTISQTLLAVEPALDQRHWIRDRLGDYGHDSRTWLLVGSLMPAQAYHKAQKLRNLIRQHYLEIMEKHDVLVVPTTGKPAQKVEDDPAISKQTKSLLPYVFTAIFNLASSPAVSVPCGLTSTRLPIGLQIGGRPGGDETVLKVAHAYEQRTPWHTMRPPPL